MAVVNILSNQSRVESPFIVVTINGYSFGLFNKEQKTPESLSGSGKEVNITYPNFMKSLSVNKINGAVNTYTISLVYAIRSGDDPNLIDKVLSSVSSTRQITISYGDYSAPNYIFKDEQAIITKVYSSVDINTSVISYTIKATSSALMLTAGTNDYPEKEAQPSSVIKEMLKDVSTGLQDVFTGMRDYGLVESSALIASDDKTVKIPAKSGISVFEYLNFLVSCMTSKSDTSQDIASSTKYIISVFDDITNTTGAYNGIFGGTYFKVDKVARNIQSDSSVNTYEIEIGYPSNNVVTAFNVVNDEAYSILYEFSKQTNQSDYSYRIDDEGEISTIFAPSISNSATKRITEQPERTWWSRMTQYPISANITIKGLLRPAVLMTYLKLNTYFYGRKHSSSGVYIITKQVDNIDESGYRTTLSLTRIGGVDL